jgi:hypothetical protein
MHASSSRDREARSALLALQRWLAEADRSLAVGELDAAEAALTRVGSALEGYRRQQQEHLQQQAIQTALDAARRIAVLTLTRLLAEIDTSLSAGDAEGVKARIQRARDTLATTQALEESSYQSGIRRRFPGREPK